VNASLQALVVEDHVAMRSVVRKMLQQMRYFQLIDDASDGEEAWAKLANGNFDLAVSDVNMPRMDGIKLLKRCRTHIELKGLPFLMISGESLPEWVASAGEWGAYDYIIKPFSYMDLKSRVDGILEKLKDPEELLFREMERRKARGHARSVLERIDQLEHSVASLKLKWLNLKGECLMELGDMESAAVCFEKVMRVSDVFLAAYKNYATVHQNLGNIDKAVEALEKVNCISPMDPDRKVTLGRLLLQAGRTDRGRSVLEGVLRTAAPEEKQGYRLSVAEVYLESGLYAEAEKLYLRALRSNPDSVEAYNRLGIALRRQGKFQEAERYYRLALTTRPNNPAIHYNLGVLHLNRQDVAEAVRSLKKALELDPKFEKAEELLRATLRKQKETAGQDLLCSPGRPT